MTYELVNWNDGGLTEVCEHFQVDLSCLVDGELDEPAAARAMVHLEECPDCRSFFDDTRQCLRLHLDSSDPDRLFARVATLTGIPNGGSALDGSELFAEAEGIEVVHRLATIFYQLGKAYLLAAVDPDFRTRVFEKAVEVDSTRDAGRGFVDGVVASGRAGGAEGGAGRRVDWQHARHMLNGRLARIESPLEKARRLLEEAVAADPAHDEARLYLAYLHSKEGKTLRASREYRDVFRTSIDDANRGHAAVQLGALYDAEDDLRRALACFRWVSISGLADRDPRFFFARFNIGLEYARMGRKERALAAFRDLLDRHGDRAADIADLFDRSTNLRAAIEEVDGFAEDLLETCPELFRAPEEDAPDQEAQADGGAA
jgi:tetratricopeptide (TPR) repeat protein